MSSPGSRNFQQQQYQQQHQQFLQQQQSMQQQKQSQQQQQKTHLQQQIESSATLNNPSTIPSVPSTPILNAAHTNANSMVGSGIEEQMTLAQGIILQIQEAMRERQIGVMVMSMEGKVLASSGELQDNAMNNTNGKMSQRWIVHHILRMLMGVKGLLETEPQLPQISKGQTLMKQVENFKRLTVTFRGFQLCVAMSESCIVMVKSQVQDVFPQQSPQ